MAPSSEPEGQATDWQAFAHRWLKVKDDPEEAAKWEAEILEAIFGKDGNA